MISLLSSRIFWESSQAKPGTPTATGTELFYDPPANLELNTGYSWQVIVVKGTAGKIKELSSLLKVEKGVKHTSISLATTGKNL